jgi:hypothetical protein
MVVGTATLSGGVATLCTTLLAGGAHSITVEYGGDSAHAGSVSQPVLVGADYYLILPGVVGWSKGSV